MVEPTTLIAFLRFASAEPGQRHRLGELTTLGRDPGNSIVIDDPSVSRHHACVRREDGGTFVVEDMGSRFGTFVAGKRVTLETLFAGIELTLGTSRLVLQLQEESSAPTPAPGSSGLSRRFDTRHTPHLPSL